MAVTDLTGYTWVGNDNLSYSSVQSSAWENGFNINFHSNSQSFNKIFVESDDLFDFSSADYFDLTYVNGGNNASYNFKSNQWYNDAYKTITITGGTDVTNASPNFATLLAWLEANGTLTAPAVTAGSIYIGSSPLQKCYVGNNEVQKIYIGDKLVYEASQYDYSQVGSEVTIYDAVYQQQGSEVTIT